MGTIAENLLKPTRPLLLKRWKLKKRSIKIHKTANHIIVGFVAPGEADSNN